MYSERVKDVLEYVGDHPINVHSQKMFYEPTSKLDPSRLPDVVESFNKEDIFTERLVEGRINKPPRSKAEEHTADVAAAMLYLACGGMDEAHNLVLPYSWPDHTHMSGSPVLNSPAIKESEYCHAMVHRKEGEIFGELQMLGFDNCKFWFSKTGYHPLYSTVKEETIRLAMDCSDPLVKTFASDLRDKQWNPDTFSDMCAEALTKRDSNLITFCNKVTQMEWRLLLDHCNGIVNSYNS